MLHLRVEETKEKPTRNAVSERLDKLYARNVKCTFCKAMIWKYTIKCEQCGVTKDQIAAASNHDAKEIMRGNKRGVVLKTKMRPDDLDFIKFTIFLLLGGFVGVHNFYVGRRIRGFIMAAMFCIGAAVFFVMYIQAGFNPDYLATHPWRVPFYHMMIPFPTDVLAVAAVFMWFMDIAGALLFRNYKYPVHLPTIAESSEPDE